MIDSFVEDNIIRKICNNENIENILEKAKKHLFVNGPINQTCLEILSLIKVKYPILFSKNEDEILETMGLYFKNPNITSLNSVVFSLYGLKIEEIYGEKYTPMQANVLRKISENKNFSFSAPTSTGKSFIFRELIKKSTKSIVIIVPSRALINEYQDRVNAIVNVKEVNVLTFVDQINTKHAKRNIFILTPERARELFKNKQWLDVELILFDEAQLSDEKSVRGLYFDSIVRRCLKHFDTAKFVFAHPFIDNPEAQLKKHDVDLSDSSSFANYLHRTVGQLFYAYDDKNNNYYHFGIQKEIMGRTKVLSNYDPVEETLKSNGSVLIYVAKAKIIDKTIYSKFQKYISMCAPIVDAEALEMIEELRKYIGAENTRAHYYNSFMLDNLKKGIVVHHGSMPLAARVIIERFTQKGFCKICFATSTLEQGINMPFDLVYLDKFEKSKPLSVKNLIGRAGRSTEDKKFDIGHVVIKATNISALRKILNSQERLDDKSHIENEDEHFDEKYDEFKDAIKNDNFSDEFNLTESEIETLKSDEISAIIPEMLDIVFNDDEVISADSITDKENRKALYEDFKIIYEKYLKRDLSLGEAAVLQQAIKILLWQIEGKTFSSICQRRYAYVSKTKERRKLDDSDKHDEANKIEVKFMCKFQDIPNKNIKRIPLFSPKSKAEDVDYDLVVYDTYDYLDKMLGFKLSDIFGAAFKQYYNKTDENRALIISNLLKYGTNNNKEIWLLRYGFSFENIEWIKPYVEKIGQDEIKFKDSAKNLPPEKFSIIERYYH